MEFTDELMTDEENAKTPSEVLGSETYLIHAPNILNVPPSSNNEITSDRIRLIEQLEDQKFFDESEATEQACVFRPKEILGLVEGCDNSFYFIPERLIIGHYGLFYTLDGAPYIIVSGECYYYNGNVQLIDYETGDPYLCFLYS